MITAKDFRDITFFLRLFQVKKLISVYIVMVMLLGSFSLYFVQKVHSEAGLVGEIGEVGEVESNDGLDEVQEPQSKAGGITSPGDVNPPDPVEVPSPPSFKPPSNSPPNQPNVLTPATGATNIVLDIQLSWSGGDIDGDTVTYDIYFGTTSPPSQASTQSGTSYTPQTLAYSTKYYWKIIATDPDGASTSGLVWDFTTKSDVIINNPSSGLVPGFTGGGSGFPPLINGGLTLGVDSNNLALSSNSVFNRLSILSPLYDSSPPTIDSLLPVPETIIYMTKPVIQAHYTDMNVIDINSVILTLDDINVPSVVSPTSVMFTSETDLPYGPHSVTVTVADQHGNQNQVTWSFTIEQNTYTIELGNVTKGEITEGSIEFTNDTVVYHVAINTTTNLTDVNFSEIKLPGKPSGIPQEPTTENSILYIYLDLKFMANNQYILEDKLDSVVFKFKVKKSWVNEHNVNKEKIVLKRYHGDQWNDLPTRLISEDDRYVYYEADTPGCSTFAIVGSEVFEIKETTGLPDFPWAYIVIFIGITGAVLGFVIVKGGYVYKGEQPAEESTSEGSQKKPRKKNIVLFSHKT
jgi:PGF-pre-PGF domain-containing protein